MKPDSAPPSQARPPRLNGLRHILLLICIVFAACSGGTGSVTEQGQTPTPDAAISNATKTADQVPTVLAGLYKGALVEDPQPKDFLTLIVPGPDGVVQAYGWYNGATDARVAYLYTGQLTLGTGGTASNVPQSWTVSGADETINSCGYPYAANANVYGSSLSQLHADLSVSRCSTSDYKLVANALPASGYNFNATPTNLANTRWNGFWSSKTSIISGKIVFDANGRPNVSDTNWDCFKGSPELSWTWPAQTLNFFKPTLTLGSITACPWEGRHLEGVAVVSTQNSSVQLDMMLLDDTGRGFSFHGTPYEAPW